MTHTFGNGCLSVCFNRNTGCIYIRKDGITVNQVNGLAMSCDKYLKMLINIAEDSERLSRFNVSEK